MQSSRPLLPEMPIFGLLGALPESFAGVISATLRRYSAFSEMTDRRFTILTKSKSTRPAEIEGLLHSQNRLDRRIAVRNVWTDLQSWNDSDLHALAPRESSKTDGQEEIAEDLRLASGRIVLDERQRIDAKGRVLQSTRYRPDGSIAVIDRLDVKNIGQVGGRRLTVFDRGGSPLHTWKSATGLYHAWFDVYMGDRDCLLVNDSSEFGGVVSSYRRDNVTTVQVLHSDYPERIGRRELSAGRFTTVTRLDWFDLVAVLTETQEADLQVRGLIRSGHRKNIAHAPNIVDTPEVQELRTRTPTRGIYVGRLATEKRVDHSIRAMAAARTPSLPLELDVYGDGPLRKELDQLAKDLGVAQQVRFHGHDRQAREKYFDASFSVLSSRSESFPLALLESMARGCIPIAYDIAFGPSTIITHGVNGILVPKGDVAALAEAITFVTTRDEDELLKLRRAAIARAQDFGVPAATRHWGELLHYAVERKRSSVTDVEGTVSAVVTAAEWDSLSTLRLTCEVETTRDAPPEDVLLCWIGRNSQSYGRISPAEDADASSTTYVFNLPVKDLDLRPGDACDIYVDSFIGSNSTRTRLKHESHTLPGTAQHIRPYSTTYGNLTIAVDGAE